MARAFIKLHKPQESYLTKIKGVIGALFDVDTTEGPDGKSMYIKSQSEERLDLVKITLDGEFAEVEKLGACGLSENIYEQVKHYFGVINNS